MVADKSNPPPVRESLVPGEEPEIDRVKLWQAWTRNAETQRAVLRRSTVVGVLAVAATLLQVGVAWYVLRRMDEVAHGAMVEVADMKGMLRASLTATTAVNAIEIEEKTSEMDALFAPEPAQEDPAAPGTVLYKPNAAREIVAKARRAERPRGEGLGLGALDALLGAVAVPAAPEAPPAAKAMLERRQAAQVQIEEALEQLAAPADPPEAKH